MSIMCHGSSSTSLNSTNAAKTILLLGSKMSINIIVEQLVLTTFSFLDVWRNICLAIDSFLIVHSHMMYPLPHKFGAQFNEVISHVNTVEPPNNSHAWGRTLWPL